MRNSVRAAAAFVPWHGMAAAAAAMPDALRSAQRLAADGSHGLALDVVEASQPADPGAPRWGEWEALRCTLLARLARSRDLLERAERLPTGIPAPALRDCLLPTARAAIGAGDSAVAQLDVARRELKKL